MTTHEHQITLQMEPIQSDLEPEDWAAMLHGLITELEKLPGVRAAKLSYDLNWRGMTLASNAWLSRFTNACTALNHHDEEEEDL